MNYFVHEKAIVESNQIGKGTRIWAFAHILPKAKIGADCNICDHVFIENDVSVGDRVTIKCGVQLWDGIDIHDDVFIGPNVTFTNDRFPRSKRHLSKYPIITVRRGASIGANATILPGISVGERAMVGAGSVVTRDVPSNAVVLGNPARIYGHVDKDDNIVTMQKESGMLSADRVQSCSVGGCRLVNMPVVDESRGTLSFAEYGEHFFFVPKRYFLVYNVPHGVSRGNHAHYSLEELLVCVKGSCTVLLDDGKNREEVELSNPYTGLYIPPLVWRIQFGHTPDAVLLVLASDSYDPDDYINDYEAFQKRVSK